MLIKISIKMKKLSLLKLNYSKVLQQEELKRIKGDSCSSWHCSCTSKQNTQDVDNELESRDKYGYI